MIIIPHRELRIFCPMRARAELNFTYMELFITRDDFLLSTVHAKTYTPIY